MDNTNQFTRKEGQFYIEELLVSDIAKQYGTPCYVYSKQTILNSINVLKSSFEKSNPNYFYSVKANSNISLLSLLSNQGFGFDIVSIGERKRVICAGGKPSNIVFSGVGKSSLEIEESLQDGIGCFNLESMEEMMRINKISDMKNMQSPIAIRVSPDIDAGTHDYLTTGTTDGKFGVCCDEALSLAKFAKKCHGLNFLGFACHIGSQIKNPSVYLRAVEKMSMLVKDAKKAGIPIKHVDMGGGFAIDYDNNSGLDIDLHEYDKLLSESFPDIDIWIEPGRSIIAESGVLLTKVEYVKNKENNIFWVVDAGMNDIIRPALYNSCHSVESVNNMEKTQTGMVVGPVCETSDVIAKNCQLNASQNDVLVIRDTGAYCSSMSSNYNSRPRAPEILVDKDKTTVIRRRETYEEMFLLEN